MSLQALPPPLTLAILADEHGLSVSLTDSLSLVKLARLSLGSAAQARLVANIPDAEIGSELFASCLDDGLRRTLIDSPPRELCLLLSENLLALPWELVFDGTSFLGEKFAMCRRLASDEPAPTLPVAVRPPAADPACLLFVHAEGDAAASKRAEAAIDALSGIDGLSASVATVSLLAGRSTAAAGAFIVHALGSVRTTGLFAAVAEAAGASAALLVFDREAEADDTRATEHHAAASALRTNALYVDRGPREAGIAADTAFYRCLGAGASLAEAARQARRAARRSAPPGTTPARYSLYGDGALVLAERRDRTKAEDSVRQVTVMSHDLVDSTRHLRALGAEHYSQRLAEYHRCCAEIVGRHGGMSDDPQGDDGIMCYFGFPVAREDAAAQCLRAALDIVPAVAALGLSIRVGVATGQVAIAAGQPVGVAVHHAARLQSIAEPGSVLAAEATQRLVRSGFVFLPLAHVPVLKGLEGSDLAFRVERSAGPEARDGSETGPRKTPFVGRQEELGVLQRHWAEACACRTTTLLVAGEAGIGKSRLMQEFRQAVAATGLMTVECQCLPDHANSAFRALIDLLRRRLRLNESDAASRQRQQIRDALPPALADGDAVALIAELLSVPDDPGRAPLDYPADKRRQLTLNVIVAWFRHVAEAAPLAVVVEDVHWIDPSTREVLKLLIDEAPRAALFIVMTVRIEAEPRWLADLRCGRLEVKGLSSAASRSLIAAASGDQRLPPDVVRMLSLRADGVPLFLEESTRMAVDLGVDEAAEASSLQFDIPSTLHDLLMARLDRLGAAKSMAQVGAVLGRDFTLQLLGAVLEHPSCPMPIADVASSVEGLIVSGLLLEKGRPANVVYSFKHALVRDAAYQSLWKRDRDRLHRTIALVMTQRFAVLTEARPELAAHHFGEAGMVDEALVYWERAARQAAAGSAHDEAIGHLGRGLGLVARLAEGGERDGVELRLQLLLAARLIATQGYGASRVERVYARAAELATRLGDDAAMMKVHLGLSGYYFMRADFDRSQVIVERAGKMAARSPNPMHEVQSTWASANLLFHRGEIAAAVDRMDTCFGAYERLAHRPGAVQDPGVMCLCYSAWGLWELGFPDEALRRAQRVVGLAERLGHRFSMGEAHGFATTVHYFRGEHGEAMRSAELAVRICEEGGFAVWLAHAKLMRGRLAAERDPEAGDAEMREAYDMWSATGAVVTRAFYLALRAEGLALGGQPQAGMALLDEALDTVITYGERYYEAEIRRLRGVLTLQAAAAHGADRAAEGERWLLGAVACARRQTLKSLELRSAESLARLYRDTGRAGEGHRILNVAYEGLTEGADTRDLRAARALLAELEPSPRRR